MARHATTSVDSNYLIQMRIFNSPGVSQQVSGTNAEGELPGVAGPNRGDGMPNAKARRT